MRIAMRTSIAVLFVLVAVMVADKPLQAQSTCGCDYRDIFNTLQSSKQDPRNSLIIGTDVLLALIAFVDQFCLGGRLNSFGQLEMTALVALLLVFDPPKRAGDDLAAAALKKTKDCNLQLWKNVSLPVDPDAVPRPPVNPLPQPVPCSCEMLVRVGDKLQPMPDGYRVDRNVFVNLQANCLPPGGSLEWSVGAPPPSTAQDITPGTGIQFNGNKALFVAERRTTTRVFAKYTTADGRMCTVERQIVIH